MGLSPILALTIYVILAVLTVVLMAILPFILAPWKHSIKKKVSFECGQTPLPSREQEFPYEYFPYLIAYITYAIIGVVVFISSITLIEAPHLAERILIFFGSLSVGALFIGSMLRGLKQRLRYEGAGER
ncbi:MAG: NADH-quinone oxidoreductase subunit A [Nitrososphaerota archaeon]|nr:NADH-quinone oxidoreductase subunit A [Candidatus Geocrenenecus dongiae]